MFGRPGFRRIAARAGIATTVVVLVLAAAAWVWFAIEGRDFVWAQIRPGDAALLEEKTIPDELPAAAWAEDVDFLARELPRRFVRFEEAIDRAAFTAEAQRLRAELTELSRPARLLGLMDLTALPCRPGRAGAGHTGISPFQRPFDWGLYPFAAYLFDDGLWITLASREASSAVGTEIVAIGGRPIEVVLAAAAPHLSADNASGRRETLAAAVSFAGFLEGLGVAEADGSARLTLRRRDGERFDLRVEPVAVASLGGLAWGRTMQEPVETWSPADPRPRKRNYWFEYREPEKLVYFQFNAVRDEPGGESLAEFAERLGGFVDRHPVDRFVIDLRANGGGNNQLVEPLLELIAGHPKIDRRGVLYTLLGRRTYSAAGNFAAALERRTKTLFAGERGGFAPNHHGDAVTVPLPRSRVLVRISTRYWEDGGPYDRRAWIAPDVPVPFVHDDHVSDHDPVLAAVLGHAADVSPRVPLDPAAGETMRDRMPGLYRFSPHKTLTISAREDGGLRLEITGTDPWARSTLYPLDAEGRRFATDLRDVAIEREPTTGTLSVDWRGKKVALEKPPETFLLPIELVRQGAREKGDTRSLRRGLSAFRELARAGAIPDSRTELALNRIGYDLLERERVSDAIAVFVLATELYPRSANTFDSLGDAHRRANDTDAAARAYSRALEIDPGFDHARRMLDQLASRNGQRAERGSID